MFGLPNIPGLVEKEQRNQRFSLNLNRVLFTIRLPFAITALFMSLGAWLLKPADPNLNAKIYYGSDISSILEGDYETRIHTSTSTNIRALVLACREDQSVLSNRWRKAKALNGLHRDKEVLSEVNYILSALPKAEIKQPIFCKNLRAGFGGASWFSG